MVHRQILVNGRRAGEEMAGKSLANADLNHLEARRLGQNDVFLLP